MKKLDELNKLTDHIEKAWSQLEGAVSRNDWPSTREAFRRMATLQDINEQASVLQQRLAGASARLTTLPAPIAPPPRPAPTNHFGGRKRPRATVRPTEVRIDTFSIPVSLSNQIPVVTANWILRQGKPLPNIPNFVQPTDSGFSPSAQIKQLDDGSYIEVGDHQEMLIQKARKLLHECGFQALRLEVVLSDGSVKTA